MIKPTKSGNTVHFNISDDGLTLIIDTLNEIPLKINFSDTTRRVSVPNVYFKMYT